MAKRVADVTPEDLRQAQILTRGPDEAIAPVVRWLQSPVRDEVQLDEAVEAVFRYLTQDMPLGIEADRQLYLAASCALEALAKLPRASEEDLTGAAEAMLAGLAAAVMAGSFGYRNYRAEGTRRAFGRLRAGEGVHRG